MKQCSKNGNIAFSIHKDQYRHTGFTEYELYNYLVEVEQISKEGALAVIAGEEVEVWR